MSLATLKKKTQAKYNNISVGTGFSLNGFRRSQGYIGQTSLSRTNIYTPLKGNTPKGHGGCCGTYNNNIIKPAKCLEDYQTIRKSVLSSKGMLRLRNKWLQRGGEYAPVKPDSNHHNNISSMLTESKRRETLNEVSTEECKPLVGTIILRKIKGYDYRTKDNNGNLEFTTNLLIVTASNATYTPPWYAGGNATIVNWEEGLQIPSTETHIVRDSRFLNTENTLKSKSEIEPFIKQYLTMMNSSVCVYDEYFGTLFIRQSVEPSSYWIYDNSNSNQIIYYDESKITDLWGVNNHEDIQIPFSIVLKTYIEFKIPLDHSEYLLRLKAKCVSNDLLQLESINNKQPFAGFN